MPGRIFILQNINIRMNTTRFITPDEIDYLRVTYAVGRKNVGSVITQDQQDTIVNNIRKAMMNGGMHVIVVFDSDNNPIASCQAFEVPNLRAWRWCGISSVKNFNHYNKTASILVPAFEMMTALMESKGYYKFWAINAESDLNIRFKITCKNSPMMSRYSYYDEMIIPKGKTSGIPLFDGYRFAADAYDVVVRLFILDQQHRGEIFRGLGYSDYKGS
jgi:hypothetical protein